MDKKQFKKEDWFDAQGRLLACGLFKETAKAPKYVKWSVDDWKKVYLELSDVTEYLPAMALVGDWTVWSRIRNEERLKPYFDMWREEVETKLKMHAIENLKKLAETPAGTAAAKWLAEGQYKTLKAKEIKQNVGRPKKEEEDTTDIDTQRINKDMGRLGLIMGGKA